MGKLLLWVLIVLAALTVWRIVNARAAARLREQQRGQAGRRTAPRGKAALPAEAMVRCAHCGIHLPRSEALQADGHVWCSAEHARLGVRQP